MNWILDHIWPFSEIRRLRTACDAHFEFGQACLVYLDHIHKPWKHIRFRDKLHIMGLDTTEVMERGDTGVIWFRDAEGSHGFIAKPGENVDYDAS